MIRSVVALLLTSILLLWLVVPIFAHDGWTQVNTPIVEPGETVYVELQFGNHSNHHASYRIEGTWNAGDTQIVVTRPDGQAVDISSTLFYMGEMQDSNNAGVNNYHIASFSASAPGVYVISAERDSLFTYGDGRSSRTLRSAKSFAAISEVPTVFGAAGLNGYQQVVSEDRAEWVPHSNPATTVVGQEMRFQLLLQGEPLADQAVSVVRRSNSEAWRLVTDDNGFITFTADAADYYLIRAMPDVDSTDVAYDSLQYEATMTYTVQNGSGLDHQALLSVIGGGTSGGAEAWYRNLFLYVSVVFGVALLACLILLFRKR